MKRRLLASILSFAMVLSLLPVTAMANDEDDVTPYETGDAPAVKSEDSLSGSCGATQSDTVAWTLKENSDDLYCVTKISGSTTSWRFYAERPDDGEGTVTEEKAYTLTISGSGAMADYSRHTTPWGLALKAKLEKTSGESVAAVSEYYSPRITQVVFAEGSDVTYIGAHAFRSTSIRSIVIPDSVKSIGAYAFIMCRQLKEIKANDISDRAFFVDNDVLYENYTENGQSGVALRFFPLGKWAGENYTIDSRVTAIGSNSIQMSEIKSVTIPESVRSIDSYAFNSSAIESVTFEGVPSFGTEFEDNELSPGAGAFSNCENLTTINSFPQNVAKLPNSLFSGDVSLKGFTIPDSVTEIGNDVFTNTGITAITIPASVTTIGSHIFSTSAPVSEDETVRTSVEVTFAEGSKLASIGSGCFAGLDSYTATFDPADKEAYSVFAQAGYQVSLAGRTLPTDGYFEFGWVDENSVVITGLTEIGKTQENIVIPDEVTDTENNAYKVVGIGDSVFAGTADADTGANITLKSVELGANIEFIGGSAFRYCTKLTTVDFSKAVNLMRIGDNAFYDVKSVTAWDLSACEELTTVEDAAFRYVSGNAALKLPANIENWGSNVIDNAANTVYVDAASTTFTTLVKALNEKSDKFTFANGTGEYGNLAYVTQYKNGEYTVTITGFASGDVDKERVEIPDTINGMKVTAVAEKAFSGDYTKIKYVIIGANVSEIGKQAFATTQGNVSDGTLESVTFKAGVPVEVGERAFQKYGTSLKTFDAGDREITLGNNVFLDDTALDYVNIPNVTALGVGVFYNRESGGAGVLVINGDAACNSSTFEDVTSGGSKGKSLTKMTVYVVGDEGDDGAVTAALKDAGANILCLTDGGTFKAGTTFTADQFVEPEKEGYKFNGWYTKNSDGTWGGKAETPVAGNTYYAKWHESAVLSTDIGEKTFKAGGDWVEFTFTTTANDDAGKTVVISSDFSTQYEDKIAALEYKVGDQWYSMKGQLFGGGQGFTLGNETSTFRVKFTEDAVGDYSFKLELKTKDENETLCKIDVPFTVIAKTPSALTTNIDEKAFVVGEPMEFTFTTKANDDVGTMVIGTSNFSDAEAIEKLEYYEVQDDNWYELNGAFGPSTGFPMSDATSRFRVTFKKAGDYTFTASMKKAEGGTVLCSTEVNFTVAKGVGKVSAPTAIENLVYNEGEQMLINAGSSTTGEIQYRLGKDGDYSTEIPKATNAGAYTVYYKVVGDANHNDVAEASITVTIDKADQAKPEAPTLKDRSYTSITLNEVAANSNGAKAKYSMDGENWQDSPEFKGLTSGTTYTFYVRYAETDDYNASPASDAAKFTTRRHSSAAVTPTPTPDPEPTPDNSSKFADVPANAYFADAVKWAVDKGITNGLSDTMFGPYESCTRAQIVTFLWRAAGSPEPKAMSSFSDVPASAYYAKAVAWAVENGITNGMTETTFAPDATCTRGQSVTFLYRALKGTASGSANFTDVASDAFYADAVEWAVANNVTNGTSATTFSPNADCTRAEIVTFLYRTYQGK